MIQWQRERRFHRKFQFTGAEVKLPVKKLQTKSYKDLAEEGQWEERSVWYLDFGIPSLIESHDRSSCSETTAWNQEKEPL